MKIKHPLNFIHKKDLTEFTVDVNNGVYVLRAGSYKQNIKLSEYRAIMEARVVPANVPTLFPAPDFVPASAPAHEPHAPAPVPPVPAPVPEPVEDFTVGFDDDPLSEPTKKRKRKGV
jgi:hypothetical protein